MLMIALPALATAPNCPSNLCLNPGDVQTITIPPHSVLEGLANNPGTLRITADHEFYEHELWKVWAPDKIDALRAYEAGNGEKVNPTGIGSLCANFEGCTTEWSGGGPYATGWWLVRFTNPTDYPLPLYVRVFGKNCTTNCD